MTSVFELRVEDITLNGLQTGIRTLEPSEEILAAIGEPMASHGRDPRQWLQDCGHTFNEQGLWPWAIVIFRQELPLPGHIAELRYRKRNASMVSFAWKKSGGWPECGAPNVSAVMVRSKGVMRKLAEKSLLFAPIWSAMYRNEWTGPFLVLADSPPVKLGRLGSDHRFLMKVNELQIKNGRFDALQAILGARFRL